MRIGRLYLIVFAGGFCSLGVELTAARLMAPFFGTSTLVWANIIGLTLLYLALGYWLGGRIADRYPSPRALGAVVLFTGATVAVMPFVTRPILSLANEAFATISAGVVIGSFAAVLLLFAIPVTALGAISPWAIRLAVQSVAEAGSVAGRLYAISTVGSLLGTFGSTLLLVPWIGARRTLLVMAVLLALSALPLLPRIAAVAPLAIALLLLVPERGIKAAPGERVVWEGETPYQFAQVVDEADGDRVLRLNEGWAVHSYAVGPSGLVGGYWDRPLCLPIAIERPEDGRLAVLGNAGGTNAIQYARFWPSWTVDGVEIDPVVSDLGYRYFGMGEANITVHDADARPWLSANEGPFDAIVIDAYRQPYIPFHLVTREFFQLVLERLAPGGAVMINVGAPPGHTQTLDRIGGTMVDVFPAVELARVNDFNTVVIGYRDAATAAAAPQRLRATPEPLAPICRSLAADAEPAAAIPGDEVLTDDHAPVEWLTDTALLEYLGEGAPGAE